MSSMKTDALLEATRAEENSIAIRERLGCARERQRARFHRDTRINCNARMGPRQIKLHCKLTDGGPRLLH